MTVAQLIAALSKIEDKDLPVYALDGGSGVSYEVGNPSVQTVQPHHDAGPLCELEQGTPFVMLYVGY